jgi:hypothetical protein
MGLLYPLGYDEKWIRKKMMRKLQQSAIQPVKLSDFPCILKIVNYADGSVCQFI